MAWLNSTVIGGIQTAQFGDSGPRWSNKHTGLDFAAVTGVPVRAVEAGQVSQAGWFSQAYGNMVTVDHGNSIQTRYAHLSRVGVFVGANVKRGQIIGNVGTTGNTTGSHVHLEVRVNGTPRNPKDFLGRDAGGMVGNAGAGNVPSTAELQSGFTRIGYFVGGLALVVIGIVGARKGGIL